MDHDAALLGAFAGSPTALGCLVGLLIAGSIAWIALLHHRPVLMFSAWAGGLVALIIGGAAFDAFASEGTTAIGADALSAFAARLNLPLAALLATGTVAALALEMTRGLAPSATRPRSAFEEARAAAFGALGEERVGRELRALGWPVLSNVVLDSGAWTVEIDHIVRAPDGIVVLETKTLGGMVSGTPDAQTWLHRNRRGQMRAFLNPQRQNMTHMEAVYRVIGGAPIAVRGAIVSAGRARFSEAIAPHVIRLPDLAATLRASAKPQVPQSEIEVAWSALLAQAAGSEDRRQAHVAAVRRRRRARWF